MAQLQRASKQLFSSGTTLSQGMNTCQDAWFPNSHPEKIDTELSRSGFKKARKRLSVLMADRAQHESLQKRTRNCCSSHVAAFWARDCKSILRCQNSEAEIATHSFTHSAKSDDLIPLWAHPGCVRNDSYPAEQQGLATKQCFFLLSCDRTCDASVVKRAAIATNFIVQITPWLWQILTPRCSVKCTPMINWKKKTRNKVILFAVILISHTSLFGEQ